MSFATVVRQQLTGTGSVDEWGMDPGVAAVTRSLDPLSWWVTVQGAEHVPQRGPALLVANRQLLGSTPLLVASAIGRVTGRDIRFTGIVDVAPIGPMLRRIGGVVSRPDEVEGLLRAGEVPAVWCRSRLAPSREVGTVPVPYVAAALATRAPVVPVAVLGPPFGLRVRIEIGPALRMRRRPGPLAEAEVAEAVHDAIRRMLDEATTPALREDR